jgi:hypothetical protein
LCPFYFFISSLLLWLRIQIFFLSLVALGFELSACKAALYILSRTASPFSLLILEMGYLELFAQDGIKVRSS